MKAAREQMRLRASVASEAGREGAVFAAGSFCTVLLLADLDSSLPRDIDILAARFLAKHNTDNLQQDHPALTMRDLRSFLIGVTKAIEKRDYVCYPSAQHDRQSSSLTNSPQPKGKKEAVQGVLKCLESQLEAYEGLSVDNAELRQCVASQEQTIKSQQDHKLDLQMLYEAVMHQHQTIKDLQGPTTEIAGLLKYMCMQTDQNPRSSAERQQAVSHGLNYNVRY